MSALFFLLLSSACHTFIAAQCPASSTAVLSRLTGSQQRCFLVGMADLLCGADGICIADRSQQSFIGGVCCRQNVTPTIEYCPLLTQQPVLNPDGRVRWCVFVGFPDLLCGGGGAVCQPHPRQPGRGVCCTGLIDVTASVKQVVGFLQGIFGNFG